MGILGIILSPLYNLLYYIGIYGPLWLLNSFWQIFTWFSGLSIGNIFFNNNSTTSINFNIDWNSDLTKIFLAFVVVGVIIFIITLLITQLAHLFKNKVSDTTLEMKTTPARSLKWVVIFPLIILLIPFGMILLSFFTSLLMQLISSAFSYINIALGTDTLQYNLTTDNINYFHNLVSNYLFNYVDSKGNNVPTILNGINGFENYMKNSTLINDALNELKNIDQSKLSNDNANLVSSTIEALNTLKNSDIGPNNWQYMDKIISILNSLNVTKSDDLANQLQNALASYNGSGGVVYNLQLISSNISQLINRGVIINDSTSTTSNYTPNVFLFNELLGSDSKFLAMFSGDNLAANAFNNSNAISLFSLPSYIQTTATQSNSTFFGTIFIYQFVTGNNDTNWNVASYYNFDAEAIARIFAGEIAVIAAMILMLLYVLYLTKRIVELACYFVLSPVVAATAPWDEGAKLTAWLKLVIVKMFSIVTLNVTFQIFYVLYPIVKTLAIDGLAGDTFLGIVPFSDLFNIFFIVAGLVAAYFATTKFSKFMGDDSSIAETFAELAVLGTAFNAAKGISKAAFKGAKKLGGKAADGLMSGYRKKQHGDKYFDKNGNVVRYGGKKQQAKLQAERGEQFDLMKRNGSVTIGSSRFEYNDYLEQSNGDERKAFQAFIDDKSVINAQKEKWVSDNGMTKADWFGGKWNQRVKSFAKHEHRNK